MSWSLSYQVFGEHAILVNWPQKIDLLIRKDIASFEHKIVSYMAVDIAETVAAYCSLTIFVKKGQCLTTFIERLKGLYYKNTEMDQEPYYMWRIPVCYDPCFAVDLVALAEAKKCTVQTLISCHVAAQYTVDFLGFLPGFAYLSGLPELLHTPRLSNPRQQVEKGSVAIGGQQTGVYPLDSPGGWHIIGRTPIQFFDPQLAQPCFVKPLDRIKFYAIDIDDYWRIEDDNSFNCSKEVLL